MREGACARLRVRRPAAARRAPRVGRASGRPPRLIQLLLRARRLGRRSGGATPGARGALPGLCVLSLLCCSRGTSTPHPLLQRGADAAQARAHLVHACTHTSRARHLCAQRGAARKGRAADADPTIGGRRARGPALPFGNGCYPSLSIWQPPRSQTRASPPPLALAAAPAGRRWCSGMAAGCLNGPYPPQGLQPSPHDARTNKHPTAPRLAVRARCRRLTWHSRHDCGACATLHASVNPPLARRRGKEAARSECPRAVSASSFAPGA